MSYKYLEDGTVFNAEELNDRFTAEQVNINDVTSSELQHGALGASHLPMMIGIAGQPEAGRTPQKSIATLVPFGTTQTYKSGQTIVSVDFDGLELGHGEKDKASALLVLFNANVEVFCKFDQSGNPFDMPSDERVEDLLFATFGVKLSSPTTGLVLDKTLRAISPGYTMSAQSTYGLTGTAILPDIQSFKDVALRSVILPSDVAFFAGEGLSQVSIVVNIGEYLATPSGNSYGVKISKVNFTCLPIQAKVTET